MNQPSSSFFEFLAGWEGEKLCPYLDKAGVPTIGIGSTFYEDGRKVKLIDTCISHDKAVEIAKHNLKDYISVVNAVAPAINQNQFDSLLDFAYNQGTGALRTSTLLKKLRKNPNDPAIRDEFAKWVYVLNPKTGKKEVSSWQVKRRKGDADLYYKPVA